MQKFLKKKYMGDNDQRFTPLDFNKYEFRVNYKEERILDKKRGLLNNILNKWTESKKTFRLIKRVTLLHENYPFRFDFSVVKTSKMRRNRNQMVPEYTIQESNVFNNVMHYEIEIELLNDKCKSYSGVQLESVLKKYSIRFKWIAIQ